MFVLMCPEGAEGSSYAMLTTMSNMAMALASTLSAQLSKAFDVDDALKVRDYSGMWKLTLLCAGAQLASMLLIPMLPSGIEEQAKMQAEDESSERAGKAYIGVLISTLLLVVVQAIFTLSS